MTVKEILHQEVSALETDLRELSDYIFANPELGHQEFKSSKAHIALLEKHGFTVEAPYAGFDTAFRATFDSGQPGPIIAYLSEYDALPSIGHGCGHNMLGTVDTGAGIALSKVINQTGGRVVVLGTPAEETTGTKVDMTNIGVFDDVDVAMCTHPSDENTMSGTSMAIHPIAFEFFGKPAHAAEAPEEGINALDAMLNLFNNINSLRQEMRSSARVHGIITHGGDAANVIPEYTRAEFYVRALDTPYMEVLSEKIINCAKAAALASGCTMKHTNFENIYKDMITNETLSAVYNENAGDLGIEMVPENRTVGSGVTQTFEGIREWRSAGSLQTSLRPRSRWKRCAATRRSRRSPQSTRYIRTRSAHGSVRRSKAWPMFLPVAANRKVRRK